MSALGELITAVLTQVRIDLPDLPTLREMEGRFDDGELKRTSMRYPAIMVSRLGCRQMDATPSQLGQGVYDVTMGAFVLTKDDGQTKAEAHQLALVDYLLRKLPEQTWERDFFDPAHQVEERPIVTAATRAKQVLATAVTWRQPVMLAPFTPDDARLIQVIFDSAREPDADVMVGEAP
ncbi:MAG: hypothetical protein AAGF71_06095 [Pseudomonadota bacterium]